jgi:gliding motility-associated-like protein
MNKRTISILIIMLFSGLAFGQPTNLIPNGNFEKYDSTYVTDPYLCDSVPIYLPNVIGWHTANMTTLWYMHETNSVCYTPSWTGTPLNSRGFEYPHSGKAYMMAQTWSNGSPDTIASKATIYQIALTDSLINGRRYCFSVFISSTDCGIYSSDAFGAYFSKTAISSGDVLNFIQYTPQVSNPDYRFPSKYGWTLVSGSFIAEGGEKYITIGSFENDTTIHISAPDTSNTWLCYFNVWDNSTAVFIDDVALYDCTGFYYVADAGQNAELCKGEEITLGWDENTNRTFKWSVVSGDSASLINGSIPRPTVSPLETTVYALYVVDEYVQEHYDTVTVEVVDCENPVFVPNIFSPNNDGQNDVLYVRSTYIQELKDFRVYNRWGEQIFQCHAEPGRSTALEDCGWDGTYHGEDVPVGVYVYYVEAVLLNGETVLKRGNITLVR